MHFPKCWTNGNSGMVTDQSFSNVVEMIHRRRKCLPWWHEKKDHQSHCQYSAAISPHTHIWKQSRRWRWEKKDGDYQCLGFILWELLISVLNSSGCWDISLKSLTCQTHDGDSGKSGEHQHHQYSIMYIMYNCHGSSYWDFSLTKVVNFHHYSQATRIATTKGTRVYILM